MIWTGGDSFRAGMSSLLSTSIPSVKTTPLSFPEAFHGSRRSTCREPERRYLLSAWVAVRFGVREPVTFKGGRVWTHGIRPGNGHDPCPISWLLGVYVWVEMYKRGKSFTGIWESLVLTGTFGDFPFANLAHQQLAFFENKESDIVSSKERLMRQPWSVGKEPYFCPINPSHYSKYQYSVLSSVFETC